MINELKKQLQGVDEVVEVRGLGLMIGIELNHEAQSTLMELQKEGVLVLTAGPNVLRLLPALTVTKKKWIWLLPNL